MRHLFSKFLVAASLLTGGAAFADNARDHRTETTQVAPRPAPIDVARRDDRDVRDNRDNRFDRDSDRAPTPKLEKHRDRRGFVWVAGQWTKSHHKWTWQPGHYQRIRR
jgi:hypothetical protein